MNKYEIKTRQTSYVTLIIEAENEDEAERKANKKIDLRFNNWRDSQRIAEWVVVDVEKTCPIAEAELHALIFRREGEEE
jgi:hypothetical protein